MISDDMVCRHDTLQLSNAFRYTGKGPYCLCYDDARMDEDSGFCTSKEFVFVEKYSSKQGKRG